MPYRRLLLLTCALHLAACSPSPAPSTAPAASSPAAEAPAPAATVAEASAAAQPAPQAVTAAAETSTEPAALQSTDYLEIPGGQPFHPVSGKIEVVEFFNYICPACNAFDVPLQAWKAKLPDDVNVVYVPADFREDFAVYARVYYAADLLGIAQKSHHDVYRAIHVEHRLPGEGRTPEAAPIAQFYTQYGVSADAFTNAMNSFAVNTRINQAHQFGVQSKISSTPSLVINGKYLVKGKDFDDKLRIAGLLVEQERKSNAKAK